MEKKFEYLLVAVIFIGLMMFFYFFLYLPTTFKGISAVKSNEQPSKYINISEQQLNLYPHLIQAIHNPGDSVETPENEWRTVYDFLKSHDSWYIQYDGEYYHILLINSDVVITQ